MNLEKYRNFMKSNFAELHKIKTDQNKGLEQPELEKKHDAEDRLIELISFDKIQISNNDFWNCLNNRISRREYTNEPLTLEELSFLLWSTQGVKEIIKRFDKAYATLRTVPSAGARHAFETYLLINNVENLQPGIYRYLASSHKLLFLFYENDFKHKINEATFGQIFTGKSAVVFIWSAVPYRAEWRYSISAHKSMLLDAGHVCQNLYLACEAIKVGTCAIAAYDQEKMDDLLKLDGKDEFVVYLAPVGKIKNSL
ncbi:MAG TPA: SagB/ThcOx family dehydrogenase [Candidatus Cloacimonetes bacterium]|nr:SagB/ThcOx family dehydrogenase [Candidatus Cloacimonadota bacterium]